MPRGDGTGPMGQGARTGRGMGGQGRGGQNNYGSPGGCCVCPACGAEFPHQIGMPCSSLTCPNCGGRLVKK
jgi:hypothetical protein